MEDTKNTLFIESFLLHQKLVETMLKFEDDAGICRVSQPELALLMNRSQTWVSSAIRRINTEDVCIELVSSGAYRVNYNDLSKRGTFFEIIKLIIATREHPEIVKIPDAKIAEAWEIKHKTVQMFKGYLLTGWKK